MLQGPWKEAGAPTVVLQIDDPNVNSEAISICLAYIYGQSPKLTDNNAYRVLAAASFLDLQVCLKLFLSVFFLISSMTKLIQNNSFEGCIY